MPPRKDAILKLRISEAFKEEVERIADETGETSAVIVRQALREYLDRRKALITERVADYFANNSQDTPPPLEGTKEASAFPNAGPASAGSSSPGDRKSETA